MAGGRVDRRPLCDGLLEDDGWVDVFTAFVPFNPELIAQCPTRRATELPRRESSWHWPIGSGMRPPQRRGNRT